MQSYSLADVDQRLSLAQELQTHLINLVQENILSAGKESAKNVVNPRYGRSKNQW
jgi:hypothetical protein